MGRPAVINENFPNRVRTLRLRRKLTLEELAAQIGLSKSALARIETGQSELKSSRLKAIARALEIDESELLYDPLHRPVPIVGYVATGGEIFPFEQLRNWEGDRWAGCPRDLNPDDTEALLVIVDSMLPIELGSIIFISKARELAAEEMLRRVCVVTLDSGKRFMLMVRRGYEKGFYNLIRPDGASLEDVQIRKAAKVRAIVPPDMAQDLISAPVTMPLAS